MPKIHNHIEPFTCANSLLLSQQGQLRAVERHVASCVLCTSGPSSCNLKSTAVHSFPPSPHQSLAFSSAFPPLASHSSGIGLLMQGETPRQGQEARPTIFGAFPELRQSSPTGSRRAQKHRHLLEAFQRSDDDVRAPSSLHGRATGPAPDMQFMA